MRDRSSASLLSRVLLDVGAVAMLVMMVLLVVESFSRYVVRSPLTWPTRLSADLLMAAIIFLPLWSVAHRDEHVRVRMLADRWPRRVRSAIWRVCSFLEAPAWALISLACTTGAWRYYNLPRDLGSFRVPLWLTLALAAVGTAGAALYAGREALLGSSSWEAQDED